jgi:hypothetical protein
MKKILAVFLAITFPVWFIPIFLITFFATGFIKTYEAILEILEGKKND